MAIALGVILLAHNRGHALPVMISLKWIKSITRRTSQITPPAVWNVTQMVGIDDKTKYVYWLNIRTMLITNAVLGYTLAGYAQTIPV